MGVQYSDGSWVETVFQSVCPSFNAPVAPTRGQQVKELRTRVCAVLNDILCSAEAPSGINVRQGGERAADDPMRCFDCPLKPHSVCLSAAAVPRRDTVCQPALNG